MGRYASPSTRTEALLLDEALASVALLNEVSQPRHVLVDLGIPDKNIQVIQKILVQANFNLKSHGTHANFRSLLTLVFFVDPLYVLQDFQNREPFPFPLLQHHHAGALTISVTGMSHRIEWWFV